VTDIQALAGEPKVERQGGGMRKYMFMQRYWSEIGGKRFLTRFVFFFTPLAGCHVTRVHMADDQRKWPHDHSATFWSWKAGWYAECVYTDPGDLSKVRYVRHRRFGIHRLRWDEAHSITQVSPHLWTVLFLGPRRTTSSYWTPDGKQNTGMKMDEEWA
jgi:hypothetical protein